MNFINWWIHNATASDGEKPMVETTFMAEEGNANAEYSYNRHNPYDMNNFPYEWEGQHCKTYFGFLVLLWQIYMLKSARKMNWRIGHTGKFSWCRGKFYCNAGELWCWTLKPWQVLAHNLHKSTVLDEVFQFLIQYIIPRKGNDLDWTSSTWEISWHGALYLTVCINLCNLPYNLHNWQSP